MQRCLSHSFGLAFVSVFATLCGLLAVPVDRAYAAQPLKHETIRFYSAAELFGIQVSVFETLFLQPWDAEHWEYPLDAEVIGRGIYTGKNQYGQPFELHVEVHVPVDVEKAGLPPAQLQWARDNGLVYVCVIGELVHKDTRLRVHGRALSTRNVEGQRRSHFRLANVLPPAAQRYEIRPDDLIWQPMQRRAWTPAPAPDLSGQGDLVDCLAACAASRDQAVQTAHHTFNARVAAADTIRRAQIVAANQAYQNALQDAETTRTNDLAEAGAQMLLCDAACAVGFPAGGVPAIACVAACSAAYVLRVAAITEAYDLAVESANQTRIRDIHLADKTYLTTYETEKEIRDAAISQAQTAYSGCVQGCFPQQGGGGAGPVQIEPE